MLPSFGNAIESLSFVISLVYVVVLSRHNLCKHRWTRKVSRCFQIPDSTRYVWHNQALTLSKTSKFRYLLGRKTARNRNISQVTIHGQIIRRQPVSR